MAAQPNAWTGHELLSRLAPRCVAHIRDCHRPGIGDGQSRTGCKRQCRNRNYGHLRIDQSAYHRPRSKDTSAALRPQRRDQPNSAYCRRFRDSIASKLGRSSLGSTASRRLTRCRKTMMPRLVMPLDGAIDHQRDGTQGTSYFVASGDPTLEIRRMTTTWTIRVGAKLLSTNPLLVALAKPLYHEQRQLLGRRRNWNQTPPCQSKGATGGSIMEKKSKGQFRCCGSAVARSACRFGTTLTSTCLQFLQWSRDNGGGGTSAAEPARRRRVSPDRGWSPGGRWRRRLTL